MEEFFMRQFSLPIVMNNNHIDVEQILNMSNDEILSCIRDIGMQIISSPTDQRWILLGILMGQVRFSLEQAIEIYVIMIRLLERCTSRHIPIILERLYKNLSNADVQFWFVVAWYFRNYAPTNGQLQLLDHLIKWIPGKIDFIDIQILKVQLKLKDSPPELILECIKTLLTNSGMQIINEKLFEYLQQLQPLEVYFEVLILIDRQFEDDSITLEKYNNYMLLVESIAQKLIYQFNGQIQALTLILLARYSKHYQVQTILYENYTSFIQFIYTEVSKYLSCNIDTQEIIDLMTHCKSETYICALLKLFKQITQYVGLFSIQIYDQLEFNLSQSFKLEHDRQKYEHQYHDFRSQRDLIIFPSSLLDIKVNLVLLCTMKRKILRNSILMKRFDSFLRQILSYMFSQVNDPQFTQFFMQFLYKFIQILTNDHQFMALIFHTLVIADENESMAFLMFQSVLKSKKCYQMLKYTLPDLDKQIIYLIQNSQQPEYFVCFQNLSMNFKLIQRHSLEYLKALQSRAIIEQNLHCTIKILQAYQAIMKEYLQSEEDFECLEIENLFSINHLAGDELVDIAALYCSKTQYLTPQLFDFVRQRHCSIKTFISFLNSVNALVVNLDEERYNFMMDCFQQEYQNHKEIVKSALLVQVTIHCCMEQVKFLWQYINQFESQEILCTLCALWPKRSYAWHQQLYILIKDNPTKHSTQFTLSMMRYYHRAQENFGSSTSELFLTLLNHLYYLFRLKLDTCLYQEFQDLMKELPSDIGTLFNFSTLDYEKLDQVMNARLLLSLKRPADI